MRFGAAADVCQLLLETMAPTFSADSSLGIAHSTVFSAYTSLNKPHLYLASLSSESVQFFRVTIGTLY